MTAVLSVEDLTVRFGGTVAVADLCLTVAPGSITGLLGPNGAGKTTTFNAISGLNRPSRGVIRVAGQDVSGMGPARRARLGLGRTFQRLELYDSLSVRENVRLGREASQSGRSLLRLFAASAAERRETALAAEEALDVCGITDLADRRAGELTLGQRRLVELARALAGPFSLLLLDEPSSGLDHSETVAFGDVLVDAVGRGGRSVLLVEHDMALVMRVCDQLYVMDFGQLIFQGTPDDVMASPLVRAAYLGEEVDGA
jgi:ABC-type branched-subunit amino acid transport system ATPase component